MMSNLKAFDSLFADLESSLTPGDVTGSCFAEGIISHTDMQDVQAAGPTYEKARILLRAIRRSMVANPSSFNTFLSILSKEGSYRSLVERLYEKVLELRTAETLAQEAQQRSQGAIREVVCSDHEDAMNRAEHTSTIVEVNEEMRDFMYCIETQPVFEDVLRRTNTRTTERMHIVNKRIKCMRLEHRIVTTLDNGATIYGEWTPVAGSEWKEEEK